MIVYCDKCEEANECDNIAVFWDETGFGYSTKLYRCKNCGNLITIKTIEDNGLYINEDDRYYKY